MSRLMFFVALALLLPGGRSAFAQDLANGQRLSERWCFGCHAIGSPGAKPSRVISFAGIAEKPGISSEMIASFLLLPHATMPNFPLKESDAGDIAAFIMKMKK